MFNNIFFPKSCRFLDNVKKIVELERLQMTVQYGAEEMQEYRYCHNIHYLIACSSTATIITRRRLIVMLYVHCVYCYIYIYGFECVSKITGFKYKFERFFFNVCQYYKE
jgi:excinuclease UvrABC helicase subunit UvrB